MLRVEVENRHFVYTFEQPFALDTKDRCVRPGRLEAQHEGNGQWIIRFYPQDKLLEAGRYVLHADWEGPPRRFAFVLTKDQDAVLLHLPGKSTELRSIVLNGCYLERIPL